MPSIRNSNSSFWEDPDEGSTENHAAYSSVPTNGYVQGEPLGGHGQDTHDAAGSRQSHPAAENGIFDGPSSSQQARMDVLIWWEHAQEH